MEEERDSKINAYFYMNFNTTILGNYMSSSNQNREEMLYRNQFELREPYLSFQTNT